MNRFYERWGVTIAGTLMFLIFVVLAHFSAFGLAQQSVLPTEIGQTILAYKKWLLKIAWPYLLEMISFLAPYVGAAATIVTVGFGIVQGILLSRRQLPRRLSRFMTEELAPVHLDARAVLSASTHHVGPNPITSPLFYRSVLHNALDALGHPWRPKSEKSLSEFIEGVDQRIAKTQERLKHLQELKAHAHLLRGATKTYAHREWAAEIEALDRMKIDAEADLTAATASNRSKAIAFELRGVHRIRNGNGAGALADFEEVERLYSSGSSTHDLARSLRLQAEADLLIANGANMSRLNTARKKLRAAHAQLSSLPIKTASATAEQNKNIETMNRVNSARQGLTQARLNLRSSQVSNV